MSSGFDDLLAANEEHAAHYTGAGLPGKAAQRLAVVTCMDCRIDPLQMLGLSAGDAKVLRNAGAQVTDSVLRELVLAVHLLGVERVMVVPHTDCRMTKVDDAQAHAAIRDAAGVDTRSLEFHTIADQRTRLSTDVQKIRSSPYLPSGVAVMGAVYDVETGALDVAVPA